MIVGDGVRDRSLERDDSRRGGKEMQMRRGWGYGSEYTALSPLKFARASSRQVIIF